MLMKNFTLAAIGLMLVAVGADDASARISIRPVKHSDKAQKVHTLKKRSLRATAEKTKIWRPTLEKNFGWDGSEWQLEDTYTISYDGEGRITTEISENYDGEFARTTYTYNANGMMATKLSELSTDGETYVNNSRELREYDEVLPSVIILNNQWMWQNDNWALVGNNYKRVITRNEAGNVTLVEIQSLFQGIYDPIRRLTVSYGADGKATELIESSLTYDGQQYKWEDDTPYKNLVWESFDGQIVDIDNLFSGGCRLKSADLTDAEMTMHIEAEYDEKGYTVKTTGNDGEDDFIGSVRYEDLDEFGSYRTVTSTSYLLDGQVYYEESETEVVKYNEWGNLILSQVEWSDGTWVDVYQHLVGTVEYDETNGYPLSYTVTEDIYDEDSGEYVTENMFRAEYFDYVDASAGISDIVADGADSPVEYYNLQGMRVASPAAGQIVIRRQGSDVSKVIVK